MNSSAARAYIEKHNLQAAVDAVVDEAPPWSLVPEAARILWAAAKRNLAERDPSEAS